MSASQAAGGALVERLTRYEMQVLLGTSISGCSMSPDRVFSLPMAWHRLHAAELIDRPDGLAIITAKGEALVAAALTQHEADRGSVVKALRDFACWAIREGAFQAADLDGLSIQEKAQELGLIDATTYDPERHGPSDCAEAGMDWFVFSPALSALASEGAAAMPVVRLHRGTLQRVRNSLQTELERGVITDTLWMNDVPSETIFDALDAAPADAGSPVSEAPGEADVFDTSGQEPRQKQKRITPGAYQVFWKSGGWSWATVGMTSNGDNWIAPANWLRPAMVRDLKEWADIERLDPAQPTPPASDAVTEARKFKLGDIVRKPHGSWWQGKVVGFYSTEQTPVGYCVQMDVPTSENIVMGMMPVQIYPETALEAALSQSAPAPETRK